MSFDPLSSMGITKGLKSGMGVSEIVQKYLDGDTAILNAYNRTIQDEFRDYLQKRTAYYQVEQRWPTSPFWKRRHC